MTHKFSVIFKNKYSSKFICIFFQNSQKGLSAIIKGMLDLGREAVVRRVYRDNTRVQLGILSPRIKNNYEVGYHYLLMSHALFIPLL